MLNENSPTANNGFIIALAARGPMTRATAASTAGSNLTVKALWVYPFETQQSGCFRDVTVIEKSGTYVRFRAGDKVYEHCGNYTIEN